MLRKPPSFPPSSLLWMLMQVLLVHIPDSMDHDSVIGLVYEVCRSTNIIQRRGLPMPVLQLTGVSHKPHMHPVHLSEPLHLEKENGQKCEDHCWPLDE